MSTFNTAFIGAGNMSGAIIAGLLDAGFSPSQLSASAPSQATRDALRDRGLSRVAADNTTIAAQADVIVLGVKPYKVREVCLELAPALRSGQLVVSVAAGISAKSLAAWLGEVPDIIRCMPNTPAMLGAGASALFAHGAVPDAQQRRAEQIMQAVGIVRWVKEDSQLHAVTAISGSGSAYFFQFMEAMINEGERMGLDSEVARTLCAQTCIGAGRMLAEGSDSARVLRQNVCSPGGTTERAVDVFNAAGLEDIVATAMRACYARSEEMGEELS